MALPASGQITYDQINVEVENASGSEASMEQMIIDAVCPTLDIIQPPDHITDWYSFSQGAQPAAPSNVVLTWQIKGSILTTVWDDNADNEDGYEVEKFFNVSPGWEACCTTGANGTTCDCTGLTGKTYTTRVRANGCEDSAWVFSNDVNT